LHDPVQAYESTHYDFSHFRSPSAAAACITIGRRSTAAHFDSGREIFCAHPCSGILSPQNIGHERKANDGKFSEDQRLPCRGDAATVVGHVISAVNAVEAIVRTGALPKQTKHSRVVPEKRLKPERIMSDGAPARLLLQPWDYWQQASRHFGKSMRVRRWRREGSQARR
jgi:hypothetical protein